MSDVAPPCLPGTGEHRFPTGVCCSKCGWAPSKQIETYIRLGRSDKRQELPSLDSAVPSPPKKKKRTPKKDRIPIVGSHAISLQKARDQTQEGLRLNETQRFAWMLILRDGDWCRFCGRWLDDMTRTLDHVIPRSQGGKTTLQNLVLACAKCNNKKNNNTPDDAGMPLREYPLHTSMHFFRGLNRDRV